MAENAHAMPVVVVDALVDNDYSLCLCEGLRAAGADVRLVTVEGRTIPSPFSVPVLPWAPPKSDEKGGLAKTRHYLRYGVRLLRLGRRIRSAGGLLHVQFLRRERLDPFLLVLLRAAGVRLVFTAHNVVPHEHGAIDRWLRALVYRSVHRIIVHSEFVRGVLLERFPVAAGKVQVVPHGNFDHYVPSPRPSRAEARAALGLADDDAVALFFGYIRPYKGLDLLLDAFEAVAGAVPRARLVIAGRPHTDRDAELIHARVLTHPASSRIIFHDRYIPHREVADYFTATDLVVLPYRHIYHSGLVHLAFSFGKATVATRVGDFPEMIDVGQTGLLVPPDSASALADTLVTALSDPSALESMGARAAVVSAEEYAWPDIGARTVSVYRSF